MSSRARMSVTLYRSKYEHRVNLILPRRFTSNRKAVRPSSDSTWYVRPSPAAGILNSARADLVSRLGIVRRLSASACNNGSMLRGLYAISC